MIVKENNVPVCDACECCSHNNLNLISQSPEGRIGHDHHRAPNAQTYRVKRMEDARESAADRRIGQLDVANREQI